MTTLYGLRQEEMTLSDAIIACQSCFSDGIGLFYSPERCFLSQIRGCDVTDSKGNSVSLDRVFEARIFNSDYELRWLNQKGGKGIAVLLSEQEIADYLAEAIDLLTAIETQDHTYLLWGEGYSANLQPGWSRLATSRLGKLDVPISGINQSKQRIKLTAREYFQALDDLYGNAIVAEERLTGLQKVLG
ncbi:CRISPR-associated protein, TIGR03984 family [Leptolyngbya sp. PCC 7375]|nr:CRISPR-associated protein, TIGR03984 family [Leptolyngbya sp. PCC 7375]